MRSAPLWSTGRHRLRCRSESSPAPPTSNGQEGLGGAVETARAAQKRIGESNELNSLADEFAFTAAIVAVPLPATASPEAVMEKAGTIDTSMEKASALLARAAEETNLSVDPELASYHLSSAIATRLPVVLSTFIALRNVATAVVTAGELSTEQRVRLLTLSGTLKANVDGVRAEIEGAQRGDPGLSAVTAEPIATFTKAADGFTLAIDRLVDQNGKQADAGRITQNYTGAIGAANDL